MVRHLAGHAPLRHNGAATHGPNDRDLRSPKAPRPFPSFGTGEAGKRLVHAFQRWYESGGDPWLKPTASPDRERQAAYDASEAGDWPPG